MQSLAKCVLVLFSALASLFSFDVTALAFHCSNPQYFLRNETTLAILEFRLRDTNGQSFSNNLLAGAGGAMNPQDSRAITLNAHGEFVAVFKMSDQQLYEGLISDICDNNEITIYRKGYNIKVSIQ